MPDYTLQEIIATLKKDDWLLVKNRNKIKIVKIVQLYGDLFYPFIKVINVEAVNKYQYFILAVEEIIRPIPKNSNLDTIALLYK